MLLLAGEGAANAAYSAEARADFDVVRKNIALEARLIDDLLDLTRITNGKLSLEMEDVDLHAVLADALANVRAEAEAKRQRITLYLQAREVCVRGDAVRLQQILWNLLRNAVKFTPPEGLISVFTRDNADQRIEIEVADTGHGMTPRELATVFDAFTQGDHAGPGGSHQFGGLGLGLTITRMLVELHSGEIRASSAGRGGGSSLTVELPLAPREECHPAHDRASLPTAAAGQAAAVQRRRILLVEDHLATRQTLSKILARRGHTLLEAATMAEALAVARAEPFEVLISDIGLPDGDGCTLMATLRQERPTLAGIAISGYGTDEDLARSAQAGFAAHLTKPVEIALIERALAALS